MRPVLFDIDNVSVLAYPVIIISAIILAVLLIRYYEIPYLHSRGLCPETLYKYNGEALLIAFALTVIGSRLGSVIVNWHLYEHDPTAALAFWRGGFAYHGGLTAVLLGVFIHSLLRRIPLGSLLDAAIPYATLAYGTGRLACFLHGCCYGLPTDLPWGLAYPTVDSITRHPTQLYASVASLIIFFILIRIHRRGFPAGYTFAWFLVLHGAYRLLVEFFRGRDYLFEPISLAQVVSMVIVLGGVVLLINRRKVLRRAIYE